MISDMYLCIYDVFKMDLWRIRVEWLEKLIIKEL